MEMHSFQLGPLGTNCYILTDEQTHRCAVVDPGGEGRELAQWMKKSGLTPGMILLTHGHFDHVGGVKALVGEYPGLPVYLHPDDRDLGPELGRGLYWNMPYEDGETVVLDHLTFHVLHTPGHTPGSVCLQVEDLLLSGDTLFQGSCGRTDFPGGSWDDMMQSLRRLSQIEENYKVCPGHGGFTELSREKASNPYMKEASKR